MKEILVVYFSASGVTHAAAEKLATGVIDLEQYNAHKAK